MNPVKDVRNHLFICCTPYHLLMAHLVAEHLGLDSLAGDARPVLLLTLGTAQDDSTLPVIHADWWSKILELPLPKRGMRLPGAGDIDAWLLETLGPCLDTPIDIYCGNDSYWPHQVIASAFADRRVFLFEDGLGSYTAIGKTNRKSSVLARQLVYKPLLGARYHNARGVGHYPADGFFSLRPDCFPARSINNRDKLTVLDARNSQFLAARKRNLSLPQSADALPNLFLTQPLVEQSILNRRADRTFHTQVGERLRDIHHLSVKAHPSEDAKLHARRLDALREGHGGKLDIEHIDFAGPVELIFLGPTCFANIYGITSTALISARSHCPDSSVISACRLLPANVQSRIGTAYTLLDEAGVEFF